MKPTHEQLLALALDEIDSPAEQEALRAALVQSNELQAEYAEIEAMARELGDAFKDEAPLSLDPHRQSEIRVLASTLETTKRSFLPVLIPIAVAASFLALLSIRIPLLTVPESSPSTPRAQVTFDGKLGDDLFADGSEAETPAPSEALTSEIAAATPEATVSSIAMKELPMVAAYDVRLPQSTVNAQLPAELPAEPMQMPVNDKFVGGRIEENARVANRGAGTGGSRAMSGSLSSVRRGDVSSESYNSIAEPEFASPRQTPLSTFSIDIDTASYTNVRRFLASGQLPPADAVRVEEMLNYFRYNYALPADGEPAIALHAELASCPWEPSHRLARVAVQSRPLASGKRPPANLVFLVDVSGSMAPENKLPLVRQALEALVGQLRDDDTVALVTYAGNSGVVLKPTPASSKKKIIQAIRSLGAGGSTNGASGINSAYEQAAINAKKSVASRVILLTDGDFNVGIQSQAALKKLIQEKAKSDIFLSVFGVGMGNLKDSTLEILSQNGNGQYGYLDSFREAQRVFVSELNGTLFTVAKDVKLQVEFNPAKVGSYRLVGYENRKLDDADFRDDRKDAGDMGAGHTVTALYEIIPVGEHNRTEELRYQSSAEPEPVASTSDETLSISIRYRDETTGERVEFSKQLVDADASADDADADFRFASAVASFGMLLRDSKYKGQGSYELVMELATDGVNAAPDAEARAERAEFIDLVRKARDLRIGQE